MKTIEDTKLSDLAKRTQGVLTVKDIEKVVRKLAKEAVQKWISNKGA